MKHIVALGIWNLGTVFWCKIHLANCGHSLSCKVGSKDHISCARIVKPDNQGNSPNLINHTVTLGEKNVQATGATSISQKGSDKAEQYKYDDNGSSKKIKIDQSIPLNSTSYDTTEAAILDLEELICRVNLSETERLLGSLLSTVRHLSQNEFLEKQVL
ncbi:hypothetical protein COLO4_16043 [Corchorus olitorius]|uniref:Uncharacterized protein n=1 Tax=Corchorus olitorius TaxID=93759 RepID=A0A1R3JK46_9ROSI|nr:hypothetical protein COLO4_16043 [Corchorus olitorius]